MRESWHFWAKNEHKLREIFVQIKTQQTLPHTNRLEGQGQER